MAPTQQADWGARVQSLGEGVVFVLVAFVFAVLSVGALHGLLVDVGVVTAGGTNAELLTTVIQFSAIALAVGWYVRARSHSIPFSLPGPRGVAVIGGGLLLLLLVQFGLVAVLSAAGFSTGQNQAILAGEDDPTYFLLMIPVSLFFVGPAEELLFRGALQGRLRETWGPWRAILLATAIFGLIHVPAVQGSAGQQLTYAVVAGALGLLLGYVYERTRNVLVPAAIHGSYNATLFGI